MNDLPEFTLFIGAFLQLLIGMLFFKVGYSASEKIRKNNYRKPKCIWKAATIFVLLLSVGMVIEALVYTVIIVAKLIG